MRGSMTVAALAAAMLCAVPAQAKLPRGFAEADAEQATGLPVHVVADRTTVRPQIAWPPVQVARPEDGLVAGHTVTPVTNPALAGGAGVLDVLIGNAVESGRLKGEARIAARRLDAAQCRVQADVPITTALQATLEQIGWATRLQVHPSGPSAVDEVMEQEGPRLLVQHSTSLTPDLIWLVTTVTVKAWDGTGQGRNAPPAWQNTLYVASAPLPLLDKTPQDTEQLLAILDREYAESGNEQRIREVNAAGPTADRRLRQLAADTVREYKNRRRAASKPRWDGRTALMGRAVRWNSDDCALLRLALHDSVGEAARLLQSLREGTLPAVGEPEAAPLFHAFGDAYADGAPIPREVVAIAPMVHLSKPKGGPVLLAFVGSVLEEDDAKGSDAEGDTDAAGPETVTEAE